MDRREFLKFSLVGVPFLLGCKLPERPLLEELRYRVFDPKGEIFEDEELETYLQCALDLLNIYTGWDPGEKYTLENVSEDPDLREFVLVGATAHAGFAASLDWTGGGAYTPTCDPKVYKKLAKKAEAEWGRLFDELFYVDT